MSYANRPLISKRNSIVAALVAAAAAIALMLSIQAPSAQAATCTSSVVCVWRGTFFSGEELNFSCGFETWTTLELKSTKNHCGVNVRIGWEEGGTTNWKACVPPGGERAEPGRFNRVLPSGC
jgi:hypothetical protein